VPALAEVNWANRIQLLSGLGRIFKLLLLSGDTFLVTHIESIMLRRPLGITMYSIGVIEEYQIELT
jgi:hypothetical protein